MSENSCVSLFVMILYKFYMIPTIFVIRNVIAHFRAKVFENLKYLGGPPSVQMQDIPTDAMPEREEDEDKRNKDVRISSQLQIYI